MLADYENRPHDSASLLDYHRPDWSQTIDSLREKTGAPSNPDLFPPHFLKKTLPSLGGKVIALPNNGAAFLFPDRSQGYIARVHGGNEQENMKLINATLAANKVQTEVQLYPFADLTSRPRIVDKTSPSGLKIQTPILEQGKQIRNLQRDIWGVVSDDFLYPSDIHSAEFDLATSLIAQSGDKPVGFLFGFHKYSKEAKPVQLNGLVDEWNFREESQLMGVLPGNRDHNVGFNLKRTQAETAKARGVEIINWTVDPLQAANAVLNINKLGGVVWEHHPDYYSFAGANALNQVIASRFSISWMVGSERVATALKDEVRRPSKIEEIQSGSIPLVTRTHRKEDGTVIIDDTFDRDVDTPFIGIEIPVNWNAIQAGDIFEAQQWRNVTDAVFQRYIGLASGEYSLTDVALDRDGNDIKGVYLIGQQSSSIDQVYLNR